jgi:hypothetical protein
MHGVPVLMPVLLAVLRAIVVAVFEFFNVHGPKAGGAI